MAHCNRNGEENSSIIRKWGIYGGHELRVVGTHLRTGIGTDKTQKTRRRYSEVVRIGKQLA